MGSVRDIALVLAARPQGVGAKDIAGPRTTSSINLRKLLAEGLLHRAGGHLEVRYFTDPERAKTWHKLVTVARAPAARSRVPMGRKTTTRAGWGRDDPCVITSETRVTIAPTPPAPTRTNTHSVY